MRRISVVAFACWTAGCGLFSKEEENKKTKIEVRDPNPPAFRARVDGVCPSEYTLRGSVCVHIRAPRELGEERLVRELADYERGAAPPRLGQQTTTQAQAETVESGRDPSKLSPDALSTGQTIDAKAAEQKRLQELQNMIDAARARSGNAAQPSTPTPSTPVANMDGVKVEVEVDGQKRTMSASEWVKQQQHGN